MKISIITVCFNAKDTIEKTFLSILNQTYKNAELVVIDGGSDDGTIDIINKYREKISYFVSEPDKGIYDAMNKGIKASSGEFIIFLNANDAFFNENTLEEVIKALNKNPEAKLLFGDAEYITEDQKNSQTITNEKIKNNFSLIYNNICHQSIFYNKSLFEKFGFYSDEFKIYADWDFNIKCLVQNKVAAIYLPTVICKFQLGGACSTPSSKKLCKKEKTDLINKHYPQYRFIIAFTGFLEKNFGTPYKWLTTNCHIKKYLYLFGAQDKYKINIIS